MGISLERVLRAVSEDERRLEINVQDKTIRVMEVMEEIYEKKRELVLAHNDLWLAKKELADVRDLDE